MTKGMDGLEVRLLLAKRFLEFMHEAYDAQLHHDVNYRHLPEYREDTLEETIGLPIAEARQRIEDYMERLGNALRAAVRRRGLRVV